MTDIHNSRTSAVAIYYSGVIMRIRKSFGPIQLNESQRIKYRYLLDGVAYAAMADAGPHGRIQSPQERKRILAIILMGYDDNRGAVSHFKRPSWLNNRPTVKRLMAEFGFYKEGRISEEIANLDAPGIDAAMLEASKAGANLVGNVY